jgi:hypothetical protein
MDAPTHPDLCGPGYRYSNRVRDLAFQVWAFKCSRQLACVADELATVGRGEGWDCVPGERTLRHWATKGDWAAATARALSTIAPDLTGGLVTDLLMGATEGMVYLRDVLAGHVTQPNSTRIRAILTALSMVGVPDLAHTMIRDALRERDAEQERPTGAAGRAASVLESVAWKEQIAARLGLSSPGTLDNEDVLPSPRWAAGTNGREQCSA